MALCYTREEEFSILPAKSKVADEKHKIRRTNILAAPKMISFSQLPTVKKDIIFSAARKLFGPSYFMTALVKGVNFQKNMHF